MESARDKKDFHASCGNDLSRASHATGPTEKSVSAISFEAVWTEYLAEVQWVLKSDTLHIATRLHHLRSSLDR